MNVTITPHTLDGRVVPPPSKSISHRLIVAAALAEGESVIRNVAASQDIEATLGCMEELGAHIERSGNVLTVRGMGASLMSPNRKLAPPHLYCGESGSTLRFLVPIALAVRGGGVFSGQGRLMERPQQPYRDLFAEKGIFFEPEGPTLVVSGVLKAGIYALPGNVSSQFFTGLLYALPLLSGESYLKSTTPLEGTNYVAMTLDAMRMAGVTAEPVAGSSFLVKGGQRYAPFEGTVETDWTQAAFWYAAQGIGSEVRVSGLNDRSSQGDMAIARWKDDLDGTDDLTIDMSGNPDLAPPVAAWAALRTDCTTRLVNAGRLRLKESDRLRSITDVLGTMGAQVEEGEDSLTIHGVSQLPGGVTVSSHGDHRIAMMAAIAATRCKDRVTVLGAECVAKSYPDFWKEYVRLGGEIEESEG